jgi:ABC-type Fe3+ transport system substrate-binding protein
MMAHRRGFARSLVVLSSLALAAACSPGASPSPSAPAATQAAPPSGSASAEAGDAEWNALVEAAQAEGQVVFAGQGDETFRDVISSAFEDEFGIEVEYFEATREIAARLLSEFEAGVYSVDVVNDGMGTMSSVYAGAGEIKDGNMGMLAPMDEVLILPETLDPAAYQEGKLWFTDPEGKYVWTMVRQTSHALTVNDDVVAEDAITSWNDLLKPEYKGKIVSADPSGFGAALSGAALILRDLGEDFFRQLYVDQEVFVCDDSRQCADQLARGGYGIALYIDEEDVDRLIQDGFNIVQPPDPPEIAPSTTYGAANIGMAANAPHPNAAKLFINWLLSKEGQQLWQDNRFEPSVRTDLEQKSDYPDWLVRRFVQPDVEYFEGESWDFTTEVRNETRETVGAILGR